MPTSSSHLKNHSISAHAPGKTTNKAPKYYGKIIVIKRNGQDSASFELSDPNYLFGRAERCDIRIQLATIGEEHCRIFPEPGLGRFAMIQNLSSVGVLVNGVLLQDHKEHVLRCGDVITIVERSFRYENPFWSEEEEELVLEETPVEGGVKIESPIKPGYTPKMATPVKQSTPVKSNNSPSKLATPTKSSQTPIKQSPKLSTPKPQLTPTKVGSPVKTNTPLKSTPAREQMTITPIKANNCSPKPSTPRLTTPMTVSQATPAQTQPSTPMAFAVSAVAQSEYQPQQSPSKFDVVMRTPVKSESVQMPQSVTPVSQTKDIGKILPSASSPSLHTPASQQQQQVTPQAERSAKSVGSAGYSALMNSGEKTEKMNEHPQSPIRGVIDHEITASPHLSPRIKMLASAHHDTDEDVIMGSPSAAGKIQAQVELNAGLDQSAQDVEMIDSADLLIETIVVEPVESTSVSMTEIIELAGDDGPKEEQVVEEISKAHIEEKVQEEDSTDSAPQPMATEIVASEAAVEEANIEQVIVAEAFNETIIETLESPDVEMVQEPVVVEPEEPISQPVEPIIEQPVEQVEAAQNAQETEESICKVSEVLGEQSAVERPDIEMSEETLVMISEEQHFGAVANDVITNDVLVNDEPMVLVETCSLIHDEPVVETEEVAALAEPEQQVENVIETLDPVTENVTEVVEPAAEIVQNTENDQSSVETIEHVATKVETTNIEQSAIADIQTETQMEPETVEGANEPAVYTSVLSEQKSSEVIESENIQQEAPLTPRRSSRLQQKSSNTSTPSKLSTEISQVVVSATRRSTRKTPAASESVTRKSTRTPKIEVSHSTTKPKTKAMSAGAVKQKNTLETAETVELNEENNDNSPSIQATRRSTRRTASAEASVEEEDKENEQSVNELKKAATRSKRSAELQSEPEMPTVRKSARTTRAK